MSFLPPEDAETIHMMRRFVAEADRIYRVRTGRNLQEAPTINVPADAYEFFRGEMAELQQEQLRTLNLSTKNKVISAPLIYQGTLSGTPVRVAEVFRPALLENAASIVVAHNHPSGDLVPSPQDIEITRQIVEAGKLLDVAVLDHIIIGAAGFVSLRESGQGFTR